MGLFLDDRDAVTTRIYSLRDYLLFTNPKPENPTALGHMAKAPSCTPTCTQPHAGDVILVRSTNKRLFRLVHYLSYFLVTSSLNNQTPPALPFQSSSGKNLARRLAPLTL